MPRMFEAKSPEDLTALRVNRKMRRLYKAISDRI